jgi:hypothetical protein
LPLSVNQREELVIVAALIIGAAATLLVVWTYYGLGSNQAIGVCGAGTEVSINSTKFCALDITSELQFAGNGYSLLPNPITYLGVRFSTVCQENVTCGTSSQSPGSVTATATTVAAFKFNLAFSDGTNETIGTVLRDSIPPPVLSHHSDPIAGFEMEGPYDSMTFFLLVQEL